MRTLRLSLAGTVTLALLGGLSAAVVAQSEGQTTQLVSNEAAVFDGTMTYPSEYLPGSVPVLGEGAVMNRGSGFQVRFDDVSDPRLAGTYRNIINEDRYGGASSVWTSATRIDNAEGSWIGHFTGYRDPDGTRNYFEGILTGTGAYDGLTAVMFLMDTGAQSYDVHGMVFPGELPEAPEDPERPE